MSSTVVSVNISREKGTIKEPVARIELNETGIVGDAHAGHWHRQVSLLSQDRIDGWVKTHGRPVEYGAFAENITLAGLDLTDASPLDRFQIGPVLLEVTQIGKTCHGDGCAIFQEVGACIMPREGLFARVLAGGTIQPGDEVQYLPHALQVEVITLSDRAAAGIYEDQSGPAIVVALDALFRKTRWRPVLERQILPDDPDQLGAALQAAVARNADLVITTGSTGVGPRDMAPEVVRPLLAKEIPGIMEHIRLKYGAAHPGALLSRSVAGVMGQTLIFALPGSVKAVREYMEEVGKVLEHLLYTVHGIDRHP